MNDTFAKRHQLTRSPLPAPLAVHNVDGSQNKNGAIKHKTTQLLRLTARNSAYHEERIEFLITNTGDHDIILGTDWLNAHNPEIDFGVNQLSFTRCPPTCTLANSPVTVSAVHPTDPHTINYLSIDEEDPDYLTPDASAFVAVQLKELQHITEHSTIRLAFLNAVLRHKESPSEPSDEHLKLQSIDSPSDPLEELLAIQHYRNSPSDFSDEPRHRDSLSNTLDDLTL
jgi:hypothetical protein